MTIRLMRAEEELRETAIRMTSRVSAHHGGAGDAAQQQPRETALEVVQQTDLSAAHSALHVRRQVLKVTAFVAQQPQAVPHAAAVVPAELRTIMHQRLHHDVRPVHTS